MAQRTLPEAQSRLRAQSSAGVWIQAPFGAVHGDRRQGQSPQASRTIGEAVKLKLKQREQRKSVPKYNVIVNIIYLYNVFKAKHLIKLY